MRYQVPQFIEVEDKIVGPFTFKQFSYILGGAGVCFIIYKLVPSFFIGLPFMLAAGGVSAAFAFYKINSRPLIEVLEAAFKYAFTKRLYIWQKKDKLPETTIASQMLGPSQSSIMVPKISNSKLKDLAWSLDINETIYSNESKKLKNRDSLRDSLQI